jgi:hypothetical protein
VRSLLRWLNERWRTTEFDRALAAGVNPLATPAIAARAEALRSRREREALASAIYLVLKDAGRSTSPLSVRVPVARDAVRRSRPELLALAAELRQAADVSVRGVAAARLLVSDGTGPLYCDVGDGALHAAVFRARVWL